MRHTSRASDTAAFHPLNQVGSVRLLRWIATVILIACTVMLGFNLVNQIGIRPGAPILMGTSLTVLLLLRWQKFIRLATWLLSLGGLFSSFMASYGTLGLFSTNWMAMPILIMISGWLLGRSGVLITTPLSLIAVVVMYLLHINGHEFPQTYALGTVVAGLVTTMLVSGLVAGSLACVFQRQLAQLNEARTHLTTLFDSLDDLIWTVDSQNFGLLNFNQAFADYILARKGVQVAHGMTPAQINASDEARAYWSDLYRRTLEAGSLRVEYASAAQDRVHQISLYLMQREGTAFAISVIAHNITEERMVQQRLEQAVQRRTRELSVAKETAEIANQAKSHFLANMSHEIRTPLTAILGFSESLRHDELGSDDRDQAIDTIIRNGRHLQNLIADILDFSKIEAGRLVIENTWLPLPELLADIHALGSALAESRELTFSSHILAPIPATLYSDPTRLKQILINLLSNAVKFTPTPGRVRLLVSSNPATHQLMFAIQDSGIGISDEAVAGLFQPFVQADDSTTRRFGGTGLGLSISRELARLLGGDISVISIENLGSVFVATIGLSQDESVEWLMSPEQWQIESSGQEDDTVVSLTGQVLLAEDTLDNQRLIALLIQRTGAELVIAQNGQEAVEKAQEQDYDLVLMDMQMPVMGGIEATSFLRLTGFDCPIVALTANATEADKARAEQAGCNGFLTKPIDQKAFFKTLAQYLPRDHNRKEPKNPVRSSLAGDPEFMALKADFLAELPDRLKHMETALTASDWAELRFRAHQLKGVAGSFGQKETSRLAGLIENRIEAGDHRSLPALMTDLVKAAGL